MDLSALLSWVRTNIKYSAILFVTTGSLLFLPDPLTGLFLLEVREEFGPYLTILFVLSLAVILITVLNWLWKIARAQWSEWAEIIEYQKKEDLSKQREAERKQKIIVYIDNLAQGEKSVLRFFLIQKEKKLDLIPRSGNLDNLVRNGIIQKTSRVPTTKEGHYQYTVPQWIYEYLEVHPEKVLSETDLRDLDRD